MLARQGRPLERLHGGDLVVAQETDLLVHRHLGPLGFGVFQPLRVLGDGDIVFIHGRRREALRVRAPLGGFPELFRRQETRDTHGIALPEIPVVVDEPVAEVDMADAEPSGVGPGLFLGGEWLDAFAFGLDHGDGPAVVGQQHVVHEAVRCVLEIRPEVGVGGEGLLLEPVLADDVLAPPAPVGEEPPARRLQELVDGNAGLGFRGHEVFSDQGLTNGV